MRFIYLEGIKDKSIISVSLLNPIRTGVGVKIFLQPIPDISWLFPTFGCGYPYEIFFSKIFVFTRWQHFWDTQYKNIFLFFAF